MFSKVFDAAIRRLSESVKSRLMEDRKMEIVALEKLVDDRFEQFKRELEALRVATESSDSAVLRTVFDSTKRTIPGGQPNTNPLAEMLRDIASLRWNVKLFGAKLANELYEKGLAGERAQIPREPIRIDLKSKLCVQADIESEWLRHWCGQLRLTPIYSRKIWEYGFVLQAIWEAGYLQPGCSGLAFAVGNEPTPAYLASRGVSVLATDLSGNDERSQGWQETGQHSESLDGLFRPDLLERSLFDKLCSFRPVDMNDIPTDLYGKFDFCWSMCSFEHVGSIEQGLEFVRNSVRCLKPGGVAAHTTEFSFEKSDETIDNWPCVLFQPKHVAELERRLNADGHELLSVSYDPGTQDLDMFIDGPPYPWQPRQSMQLPNSPIMRINVDGFPATSIGLIIRARRS